MTTARLLDQAGAAELAPVKACALDQAGPGDRPRVEATFGVPIAAPGLGRGSSAPSWGC